ncbi:SLAM family member 5-like [Sinocyclocheilus grahami]|uniref:SLAM family member 5-like n=1 Tax=Sinocyclocheilus grahami TaxID=75366 RepID=UPI0007AD154A|nr:PREDICTED: SLAM family member 5-like [Sinocyclocheilus grahami]
MEGDSVTLNSDVTEIHEDDDILWKFGAEDSLIAEISVFGESVSVMEGDSVTLNSDVTEIHEDDDILWKFGAEDSLIAEISREDQIFSTFDVLDGRFRNRLKLDNQTESLTITDVIIEHAGHYKLQISGDKLLSKTFSVSIYARLPTPYITRDCSHNISSSSQQNCSLVCSVVNVGHVSLSWYKGNSLLSSISVSDLSISLSLPLEVEYQDKNTYSCVLNNPISNQTTHLDITQLCQIHSELSITDQGLPLFYILIPAATAGSLLIVVSVVMCCTCKKCRKTVQTHEEESDSALCKPKTHKKKSKSEAVYENVPKKR